MNKFYAFLWLCIFNFNGLNASELEDFFDFTKNRDYNSAQSVISNSEDLELKTLLSSLLQIFTNNQSDTKLIEIKDHDYEEIKFLKHMIYGYRHTFSKEQDNLEAFINFTEALKLSNKIENQVLTKAALIAILDLFRSEIFIGSKQYKPFLKQFIELKSDRTDEALIIFYNLVFYTKADDADDEIDNVDTQYYSYYDKLDSIFLKIPKSHSFYPNYYFEKGIYYKIQEDYKKAEEFFLKADSLASNNIYLNSFRKLVAWQLAAINMENNQLQKSKNYLKISQNLSQKLKDTFYNNRLNSLIFEKENKLDSAYNYLRKSVDAEYKLGYKNNTLESSILSVQNQTDKLKLDKLELDTQNRKIRNWLITLVLLLIFGSAIAFLTQKNTKRKQLLAEQQKMLQEQKVATLLKEQELTTIDAMIEGQEKERQRIANDLHDDLGGLMATVKLHFNALHAKVKDDSDEMYEKTNDLIDEAYHKIRAIAHAKNSGVIAKQGLLKAVHEMTEKVSTANSIKIEVQDFGLDNRLENSLELILFRVIQELITNIIKHSEATRANIHLTNHGDNLNILVEDNGIGFDASILNSAKKGMGLKSIDKRITHLEGTIHIESELGKGATIILDIPL